jgi:hypothetical protein
MLQKNVVRGFATTKREREPNLQPLLLLNSCTSNMGPLHLGGGNSVDIAVDGLGRIQNLQ